MKKEVDTSDYIYDDGYVVMPLQDAIFARARIDAIFSGIVSPEDLKKESAPILRLFNRALQDHMD